MCHLFFMFSDKFESKIIFYKKKQTDSYYWNMWLRTRMIHDANIIMRKKKCLQKLQWNNEKATNMKTNV